MRSSRGSAGPATITDIARKAGVSRTTVCMSLKDHPRISVETKTLVRSVARDMGYRPDHVARKLVNKRLGISTAGHIVAMSCSWDFIEAQVYYNRIMQGMLGVLVAEKYSLLAQYPHEPFQEGLPEVYARGDVDGVVIYGPQKPTVDALRSDPGFGNRPIVTLMHHQDGCSAVVSDDYPGAYESAAHLISLGHRHILHFIADEPTDPVRVRYRAYRKAFEDHGLDPEQYLHHALWLYYDPDANCAAMKRAMEENPGITAVLARTDAAVPTIQWFLQEEGLRIPEDISLIGFDDVAELPGANGQNMLTVVRVPLFDIGAEAARLVVSRARGEASEDEVVELKTNLIVRGSTAPAPKRPRD